MILLISDLHLQEERPDISRAFLDLLDGRARHAKALYILGDFFEAWIGDDAMTPFQQSICQAMRRLSDSGTAIFLMHGNRDFLAGQDLMQACGAQLLADPGIVRNRLKVAATILNAQAFLSLQDKGQRFGHFVWQFVNGQTQQYQRRLKGRNKWFQCLGFSVAYRTSRGSAHKRCRPSASDRRFLKRPAKPH